MRTMVGTGPAKVYLVLLATVVTWAFWVTGCTLVRPVVRTVNDIARDLCTLTVMEQTDQIQGLTPAEFCEMRDNVAPFIDEIMAAKRTAGGELGLPNAVD